MSASPRSTPCQVSPAASVRGRGDAGDAGRQSVRVVVTSASTQSSKRPLQESGAAVRFVSETPSVQRSADTLSVLTRRRNTGANGSGPHEVTPTVATVLQSGAYSVQCSCAIVAAG